MKNKFKALLAIAIIGAATALMLPARAQFLYQGNDFPPGPQFVQPMFSGLFTNVPTIMISGAKSNINARIPVRQGFGLTVAVSCSGTNTSVTNDTLSCTYNFGVDGAAGKVYTTTGPIVHTVTLNSNNTTVAALQIWPTNLYNVEWVELTRATNNAVTSNSIAIAGVRYQYFRP